MRARDIAGRGVHKTFMINLVPVIIAPSRDKGKPARPVDRRASAGRGAGTLDRARAGSHLAGAVVVDMAPAGDGAGSAVVVPRPHVRGPGQGRSGGAPELAVCNRWSPCRRPAIAAA